MAVPRDKDLWINNPFSPGPNDLSDMLDVHRTVIAGDYANRVVEAKAQFMPADMAYYYNEWATHHPTMDPMTWAPLAERAILPDSPEGTVVAGTDILRQVSSGQYGAVRGQKPDVPPAPATEQVAAEEDSGGIFGWFGDNIDRAKSIGSAITPDFVGSAIDTGFELQKGQVRALQTVGSAALQFGTAEARTNLGNEDAAKDLLEKHGLEVNDFNTQMVMNGLEGLGQESIDAVVPDPHIADAIEAAHAEYVDTRPDTEKEQLTNNWLQTELGQVSKSFVDDIPGNLMTSTVAEGSVQNKKGEWINPATGEPAQVTPEQGWLPNQVAQANAEERALATFDIRTPEEIANKVAPIAWTPGRGLAHIWYSPDETAFNAISGATDFGVSLGLDPMNVVPAGAAVKALKYFGPAAKAFRASDEAAVIATSTFAGSGGIAGAREGARGATIAGQVLDEGAPLLLDESLAARGFTTRGRSVIADFDPETGIGGTNVPHGKFVVNRNAWSWLSRGRGARVVDELAQTTSPTRIMERSGQKMDADLAIQLADAPNASAVRSILATRMGYDLNDPSELGKLGRGGPTISRVPLWSGITNPFQVAGTELAGGGLVTKQGRAATQFNLEEFGWMGAVRGLYRRPFRMAPNSGNGFDLESADDTYREWTSFSRGLRMDEKTRIGITDDLLRARNGVERYNVLYDPENGALGKVVMASLMDKGITEGDAKRMSRAFAGGIDPEMRQTLNQDLPYAFGAETSNGEIGRALMVGEMLSRHAQLPDYRSLARATSAIGAIRGTGLAKADQYVADALHEFTSAWRSAVLMRPAYTLREIGELAWSMSLAGNTGAFTHPATFLGNMVRVAASLETSSRTTQLFAKVAGAPISGRRLVVDRVGRLMMANEDESLRKLTPEEFAEAVNKLDPKEVRTWLHTQKGFAGLLPHLDQRWARVNGQAMFDEITRFRETDDIDQLSDMFHQLNGVRGNMMVDELAGRKAARHLRALPRDDVQFEREYLGAYVEKLRIISRDRLMKNLADPNMTREQVVANWQRTGTKSLQAIMRKDLLDGTVRKDLDYVDGYEKMLQGLTFGDERLLDAVMTGRYADKPINAKNKELMNLLEGFKNDEAAKYLFPEVLHDTPYEHGFIGKYRQASNTFFASTGDFSDLFARGPTIRQDYVERVIELAPAMTPQAKAKVVASLREAGDYTLARKVAATKVTSKGTLGVEEVDAIASGYARKQSARKFYDAHRRQNYALAIRIAMPFAQATFNTFRRWGEFSWKNPEMMYRTTKPIEALTDPGSAALYDIIGNATGDEGMQALYTDNHPEASVNGFFFTNSYGDRQFAYPLVGKLAQMLPFIDAPRGSLAVANAEGLNVAGVTLNPGMGPLVTAAAATMTGTLIHQDNFAGQFLRLMFPYGLQEGSFLEKVIYSMSPTAVRKMGQASDPEAVANGTMRSMAVLIGTGDYDLTQRADIRRLRVDARALSVRLAHASGFFGALTPSTFSWQSAIAIDGDKSGAGRMFMLQDRLIQEFRKYTAAQSPETSQNDYNRGFMQFVDDYGTTALYSVMPMTETNGDNLGLAPTNDIWSWRTDNPDAYNKHSPVIGMFFPGGDPASEFSTELYRWQKATGERVPKDPEDFVKDVNSQLGWALYTQATKRIMRHTDDPEQQAVLNAQVAAELENKFPGFIREQSDPKAFRSRILEMQEAVKNPQIELLPGTPFIARYLSARRQAIHSLQERGYVGTLSSDYAAPERDALLQLASALVRRDTSGTFVNAWTRLFADEYGLEE